MPSAIFPGLLLTAALALTALEVGATTSTSELAEELNALRQEKRQLEREVAQYRASIDLLRANGASGINSASLQSLSEEAGRTRARIKSLSEREQALIGELGTLPGTSATALDPAAAEVARLTQLLNAHYSNTSAVPVDPPASQAGSAAALPSVEITSDKVLLTGAEGVAAITLVSERLPAASSSGQTRQVDIVFNVETRRGGELVSSRNYSLRALGNGQYVGKLVLEAGEIRVAVRSDTWRVQLDEAATGEFLVTLHTPVGGQPRLHLISVEELLATRWDNIPSWLPPIGASPGRS